MLLWQRSGGKGTGRRLGPYEIVCMLGAGGMGKVYRAVDTNGRTVAIKVLPTSARTAKPEGSPF